MGLFGPSKTAALTERNLNDQSGRVYIITGSTAGVGKELAGILYTHNATVYIAARNATKAESVIGDLEQAHPGSNGSLRLLQLDQNDLESVKSAATTFLRQETRLDVLVNNAGIMIPPAGTKTAQGYEAQLGTNALAPFLLTKLLTPLLVATAKTAPAGTVRVVWTSSSAANRFSPNGGVDMKNLDYKLDQGAWHKYGVSKAGDILLSKEFAARYEGSGVLSFSLDPGNLKTDLYKNMPGWQRAVANLVLAEPIYGAYTTLFAACSQEICGANGAFIQPFGKIGSVRKDIETSSKAEGAGGTGIGKDFWEWSEKQVLNFV